MLQEKEALDAGALTPQAEYPRASAGKGHIAYLDGLRGVAILAVIMVHTSLGMGLSTALSDFTFYGVRGVQLFFIVSGLTLTLTHLNRPLALTNFAARRFFRIAPMFYLGALLYLAAGKWTDLPVGTHDARRIDFLATFLLLNGWLPHDASRVVPGGWSIGAEVMFYTVFPAILTLTRHPRRLAAFVAMSYVVAGAVHLALAKFLPQIAMTFWLCQLPAFGSGCLLAVVGNEIQFSRRVGLVALWGSVAALILDSQLRGHSNLLVAVVLLSIFVWAVSQVKPSIFQGGILPYLGKISFSMYILHFALLGVVSLIFKIFAPSIPNFVLFLIVYLTTVGLAAVAASISFRFIERPFINVGRKFGRLTKRVSALA